MGTHPRYERAEKLRALHDGPRLLLLPNAWDVASARVYERAGFAALATTSAGIAFSIGYADGERIGRKRMLEVVARIAGGVDLPVTADVEGGYGSRPEDAADTARAVIEAGAAGMNLEDWTGEGGGALVDAALHAEKIRAVREAGASAGVPLVINARTDVFRAREVPQEKRIAEAVRRASLYRDAGADCIFTPFVSDRDTIAGLAHEVPGPLNILAGPGVPPLAELERLGVRRVTLGSGPMRATLGYLMRIASELLESGTYGSLVEGAIPYADLQSWFSSPTPVP